MAYFELTAEQALARYATGAVVVLDVRTDPEWLAEHIPGAVHIPLHELSSRWQELDPEAETLLICGHGIRSAAAGQWLHQAGFENLANVRYGMSGWPGPVTTGGEPLPVPSPGV